MMETVNRITASPFGGTPFSRVLAGLVLAASLGTPALAGQASGSFNVSITFVPASTSCSAAVNGGAPLVSCGPVAVALPSAAAPAAVPAPASAPAPASIGGAQDGLRFRLPDTRVRLSGSPVDVRDESASAWGEYSSRIIASGGIEYLEMTVTW